MSFFKNISNVTLERFNNKFIFSFIISWAVFNFKGIAYFVFAKVEIAKKLETISTDYVCDFWSWAVPLMFAIFYVVGLPYVQNYFDKWTAKATKEKNDAINKKEADALNHQLNMAKINVEILEAKDEFSSIKKMTATIEEQGFQINELINTERLVREANNALRETIKNLQENLKQLDRKDISEEDRNKFIKEFEDLKENNPNEFGIFIKIGTQISMGETLKDIDHLDVERFKAQKLIQPVPNSTLDKRYDLTKKGSIFWTQYALSTSTKASKEKVAYTLNNVTIDSAAEYSRSAANNKHNLVRAGKTLSELSSTERQELFLNIFGENKELNNDSQLIYEELKKYAENNPQKFLAAYDLLIWFKNRGEL